MGAFHTPHENRYELESRILATALKQSFERGDMSGALLAHRQLTELLRQKSHAPDSNIFTDSKGFCARAAQQKADISASTSDLDDYSNLDIIKPEVDTALETDNSTADKSVDPPIDEVKTNTLYDVLGVDPLCPFESIHINFFKIVKRLLSRQITLHELSTREFKVKLIEICVAHDILRDPRTRTDYDFRLMGLRDTKAVDPRLGLDETRGVLRIGELLQCSRILEPAELDVAVDMHKAMPEMPFGQFLVKQGFLTEKELYAALLGQRLIINGKITVTQFQAAMYSMHESSIPLAETLLKRGWARSEDIDNVVIPDHPRRGVPAAQQLLNPSEDAANTYIPAATQTSPTPEVSSNPDAYRIKKVTTSNTVPSWAQQIDWQEDLKEDAKEDLKEEAGTQEVRVELDPEFLSVDERKLIDETMSYLLSEEDGVVTAETLVPESKNESYAESYVESFTPDLEEISESEHYPLSVTAIPESSNETATDVPPISKRLQQSSAQEIPDKPFYNFTPDPAVIRLQEKLASMGSADTKTTSNEDSTGNQNNQGNKGKKKNRKNRGNTEQSN